MDFKTCYWTKAVNVREKRTKAHGLRHPTLRGGKKNKNRKGDRRSNHRGGTKIKTLVFWKPRE